MRRSPRVRAEDAADVAGRCNWKRQGTGAASRRFVRREEASGRARVAWAVGPPARAAAAGGVSAGSRPNVSARHGRRHGGALGRAGPEEEDLHRSTAARLDTSNPARRLSPRECTTSLAPSGTGFCASRRSPGARITPLPLELRLRTHTLSLSASYANS